MMYIAYALVVILIVGAWFVYYRTTREPFFVTGLRSIDIFAPIRFGTDVVILGQPRTGMWVLTWELTYRLLRHPRFPTQVAVFIDESRNDTLSLLDEMKEALPDFGNVHVVTAVTPEELQRYCKSDSSRSMAIALSDNEQFVHLFREAVRATRDGNPAFRELTSLTTTLLPLRTGFDTVMVLAPFLAGEGIYPAIDVDKSATLAMESSGVSHRRRQLASSARSTISEAIALLNPGALGDADSPFNTDPARRVPAQLIRYMSQPMFVAEKFTGKRGEFIPLAETTTAFDLILRGKVEHVAPQRFMYVNSLPS